MSESPKKDPMKEISDEAKKSALDAVVALLALIQSAKTEAGGGGAAAPPLISNLLFDLGKLQMETLSKLASISAEQTGTLVTHLRERRAAQRGGQRPATRALLSLEMILKDKDSATGKFCIKNFSTGTRTYPIPEFIELERLEDKKPGAFVPVTLQMPSKGKGVLPASTLTIPGSLNPATPGEFEAMLCIPADPRLVAGRYRGIVPFEAEGVPSAELIVELHVVDPQAPPPKR